METVFVKASGPVGQLNAVPDLTGVGGQEFVESAKAQLGIWAKRRNVRETGRSFELREPNAIYFDDFDHENNVIGPQNTYFRSACS